MSRRFWPCQAGGETFAANGVYADAADLYNFDQPEEEGELTTNQRFEKLRRLEQLGIFVDEAHHAFGKALAKDMGVGAKETDTSLRTTIDILAASPWGARCCLKWSTPTA